MERVAISVLINNYNYGSFVGRAVESALNQLGGSAEVIVVDDGSSDHSRSVLEGFGSRVKVLLQENHGQAAAINAAVHASNGEVLCFLDADDWWAPGKLSATAAAFQANPKAALVYHRLQPMLGEDRPTLKPIPRTLCSGDLSPRLARSAGWWPFPMTSAIAVRRTAWDGVGDIPVEFRISADAWLAGVYPFVGNVVAIADPLGFYRIHDNNWYRATDDGAMLRKRMDHWRATVEATNGFLAANELPTRLRLLDHYPYQIAHARLKEPNRLKQWKLTTAGLLFAGEPNLLRRARDTLRAAKELIWPSYSISVSDERK